MHLGLIGYGNIGRALLGVLVAEGCAPERVTLLVRPGTRGDLPGDVVTDSEALVAARPDLIVECAGHSAVAGAVVPALRAGIECVVVSIGALADAALHDAVRAAARAGGTRVVLPAGAIGGVDLLASLKPAGIASVVYTSRKPPLAWKGTPAEALLDLSALTGPATFFTGNAREAALAYPKNANVAATLALAGLGFEETRVEMVADPTVTQNIHEYRVRSGAADYAMRIEGKPSPDNPKTSLATVYSAAREVMNRLAEVAI
ncbi:MAG: aspartate dehydrogenase [Rhodobacteraceae bacterium]|nr:aspartate dehydrogenase [Paracoccaceae bacterium]